MVERVIPQAMTPTAPEVCALLGMGLKSPECGFSAARRLEMDDPRERRPKSLKLQFFKPQTKIDIVELNRQMNSVEAAGGVEFGAFHGKTSARHRRCFMNDPVAAKPTELVGLGASVAMACGFAKAKNNSRVLNAPIPMEQFTANRPHLGV